MRTIEQFQIRKIYAIGNALGIKASGSEDELHALVGGVTGKDSIKSLNIQRGLCGDCPVGRAAEQICFSKAEEHKAEGTQEQTGRSYSRTTEKDMGSHV